MRDRRRSPAERPGPAGAGAARSDYRSFRSSGGFRRSGQTKQSSYAALPPPPPPPPPPPLRHRADVLLEAGRLAAEYLVAKGLLPAGSLSPSTAAGWWPNGGGEERGRASALSRLGRRRFDDDDDGGFGGRKRARRRRNRSGSYGRRGSEWGRENGRGGPWTETRAERGGGYSDAMDNEDLDRSGRWSGRGKGSLDTVEDEDSDRQDQSDDSGFGDAGGGGREPLKAAPTDELLLVSKGELTGGSELEPENHNLADETGSKTMEEIEVKTNPVPEADMILKTRTDDFRVSDLETEEVEKVKGSVEADRENGLQMGAKEDLPVKSCPAMVDKQVSNHGISLLCGFVKAPTKPRSSVTNRNPRTDQKPSAEDVRENSDASLKEGGLKNKADEVSTAGHSNDALTDQFQSSRGLPSEISTLRTLSDSLTEQPQSSTGVVLGVSRTQSAQLFESVEYCLMSGAERRRCSRSHSFPESSLAHVRQETSEGPPGFELPRKSIDADGTKIDESPVEHTKREGMKQPREWSPSSLSKMDEYFRSSTLKQFDMPVEKLSQDHEMVDATEQNHTDKFPKAVLKSVNKFEEQRQFASTSFKICDLNLMEAPEITDISDSPVLEHVPTSAISLETENNPSVSFDLSINQRQNETDSHGHHSSDDKVAPVIDLEDDSPVEVDACDTSQTRSEPIYPNLENFLNHPENPVGLPNIQDGYGLAISEFLGNDIAGCPAVHGDISDLQTFHDAEGIAGNDDSLYVNLGEIPLNFMEVWDQPPPEYEKFF